MSTTMRIPERTRRLFRIQKTIYKMLRKRKFAVRKDLLERRIEDFIDTLESKPNASRKEMDIRLRHISEPIDAHVFFLSPKDGGSDKVGTAQVKDVCHRYLPSEEDEHGEDSATKTSSDRFNIVIFVIEHGFSPPALTCMRNVNAQFSNSIRVEYFLDAELVIDITEHELVPKHEVLSEDEKNTLLERYKLKEHQLPKIQRFDAVARYFGLKKGEVVKITRDSETAGKYVTYRVCVDNGVLT